MRIFVDFDGTLLDSSNCWNEAYLLMCHENNLVKNDHILKSFYCLKFNEWILLIKNQHNINDVNNFMLKYAIKVYIKRKPKNKVINYLKNYNDNIFIISREEISLIKEWLDFYGLHFYKDIKTINEERKISEFYDNNTILIDDSLIHCIAAKKSGAYVIGIDDHHSEERKKEMKNICDEYWED